MIRVCALVGALLAVTAGPARAAEPIRIGCLAALSGAGADIGNRLGSSLTNPLPKS